MEVKVLFLYERIKMGNILYIGDWGKVRQSRPLNRYFSLFPTMIQIEKNQIYKPTCAQIPMTFFILLNFKS